MVEGKRVLSRENNIVLCFFLFIIYLFYSGVCGFIMCHGVHVEVSRQLIEVLSFLPLCGSRGLNSGGQA